MAQGLTAQGKDLNPAIAAIGHVEIVARDGNILRTAKLSHFSAVLPNQGLRHKASAPWIEPFYPRCPRRQSQQVQDAFIVQRHSPRQKQPTQAAIAPVQSERSLGVGRQTKDYADAHPRGKCVSALIASRAPASSVIQ